MKKSVPTSPCLMMMSPASKDTRSQPVASIGCWSAGKRCNNGTLSKNFIVEW